MFASVLFVFAGLIQSTRAVDCVLVTPDSPMEVSMSDFDAVFFSGVRPIVSRIASETSMIKVTRYSTEPMMKVMEAERALMVMSQICNVNGGGVSGSPAGASTVSSAATASTVVSSALLYLGGASYGMSLGIGLLTSLFPSVEAQLDCEEVIEIEIHGPDAADGSGTSEEELRATIAALQAEVASLNSQLNGTLTAEEADASVYDALVSQIAFGDFASLTPLVDQTIARVSNDGQAERFDVAGFPIFYDYNPEAQFYLANAGDDSLVRDMQGDVFQFPTESNEADEVNFTLPDPPMYSQPSDLYYMPILEISSLIQGGAVSCVEVVQAFVDRLSEFDPYLGIVATPLYDRALETAALHDTLLAEGTNLGPLMCIPFGVKDHHQIYDDEPTMYGSLLHATNVQSVKSTLMQKLLDGGAIPIAKMMLGTFAWSSANGWGECMSPYLNGPGCGSSCGSASGAAFGALPFAISEETSGSIACPSAANLISGHIGSYGTLSRAGAGLLCSETDHLGFHSRYLSDFGVIFNYARTGDDPLDGDSVAIPYVNPADVNLTELRVMIIEGNGEWVFDNETATYSWNEAVRQSYGKTAWHWPERVASIKSKLDAAGVMYDSFSLDEANQLWSFNSSTPYFDCASPEIDVMMAAGPWAQLQECEACFQNSKWKTYYPKNIPKKSYRYLQFCMKEMGKLLLNDNVWATYDVIIETHSSTGGGYDIPGGSFEQWVRTAKTFVMDYYEALPCAHTQGDTVEGTYTVLTAKPFEDHKNFAIGTLIQDPASMIFPNDTSIKTAFTDRTRCPFAFYEGYNNMSLTCPPLNSDGAPPGPTLREIDGACVPGDDLQHLPEDWANEPYMAPYDMEEKVPDRAIWRWDEYGPVACTAVCPFVPAFCELKGIVCDARRLEQERHNEQKQSIGNRQLSADDIRRLRRDFQAQIKDGGEL